MGKYMRKAKITGEVAVMEVSPQSPLGVRTRAKTLALQRLQMSPSSDSSCYLQLRSRRLEKALNPHFSSAPVVTASGFACGKSRDACKPTASPSGSDVPTFGNSGAVGKAQVLEAARTPLDEEGSIEASFGDNVLDVEARERLSRETTPCSLIPDLLAAPGSTTRPGHRMAGIARASRNIPTALEMEEFFSSTEQSQQRIFMEKYNFDLLNDCPLPGRYEWEKLDSL